MKNILSKLNIKENKIQSLVGPTIIMIILSTMILPLSPLILDVLLTFNILSSIVILLISIFKKHTLEFTVFPTILLFSTLLRLSLNIASTRTILMYGHNGQHAAGQVINSFSNFLVGNNIITGIVVFIILIIINFIVITKGSSRIAEVGARFILDGMPGKQMAIDADLNSGIIGEKEAKKRRFEITQEASFYGAMDGASKFVRGDAIASLLIILINLIGGFLIGTIQHDMNVYDASKNYTLLTIGDGLVAQIPALMISTATGMTVTRVDNMQDINEQIINQIFKNPKVILISASIIGFLGIIPGMPRKIFLLFAILLSLPILIGYRNKKFFSDFNEKLKEIKNRNSAKKTYEANWNDISIEDALRIELGYQLISMVDNKNSELLNRIIGVRKKFANDIGYLPPVVHIQDNINIDPNKYMIMLNGVKIGEGYVYPKHILAISSENKNIDLPGNKCYDPVFGLQSIWINEDIQEEASNKGYTIVNASTVIATHFNQLILKHSEDLFGHQEVQQLIDYLKNKHPKLIENIIPDIISITTFHKVLKNLLFEKIPIKDLRSIIECLIENSQNQNDIDTLTNLVRSKISRFITQNLFKDNKNISVIGINPNLEQTLIQVVQNNSYVMEPNMINRIVNQVKKAIKMQNLKNLPTVILVIPILRSMIAKMLCPIIPEISVISSNEIYGQRNVNFIFFIE